MQRRDLAVGVLVADCVALMVVMGIFRVVGAPPSLQLIAGGALLVSFGWLAAVRFRLAVAIVLLELVVGGASGHWALFPGGLSGRMVLFGIVLVGAMGALLGARRRTGSWALGRYGLHAIAIAFIMPAVWMPLGVLNGNRLSDVVGDGNGQLAFLVALPLIVLIRDGHAGWLRGWLLWCCAVNAIATGLLVTISVPGWVPVWPTLNEILLGDLGMGGAVGYMADGSYRLFLGSGLYLQIGLALTTWHLVRERGASWWLWALYALLWACVIATYTRGFWIGAAAAVLIVAFLTASSLRRPIIVLVFTTGLFVVGSLVGALWGFSLPDYVGGRLGTVQLPDLGTPATPGIVPPPTAPPPRPIQIGLGPEIAIIGAWLSVAILVGRSLFSLARRRLSPPRLAGPAAAVLLVVSLAVMLLPSAYAQAADPTPPPVAVDAEGPPGDEIADQIRAVQARVLLGQVRDSPLIGHGFGSIAPDYPYGQTYSYELGLLDLTFKTGAVGLLIFLSLPLRLVLDALRARWRGRPPPARGLRVADGGVAVALVLTTLFAGATNPYILAAFGLAPLLIGIAWLEPEARPVLRREPAAPARS